MRCVLLPLAARSLKTSCNLVLVHRPGWQAVEDFLDIRSRIAAKAPEITVMIASTHQRDPALEDLASRRPTVVVSPAPLGAFKPKRGRVYHGRPIAKDVQTARLAALGIPVPRTTVLTPGISLDPAI